MYSYNAESITRTYIEKKYFEENDLSKWTSLDGKFDIKHFIRNLFIALKKKCGDIYRHTNNLQLIYLSVCKWNSISM